MREIFAPVSYTHLDVYKRQPTGNLDTQSSANVRQILHDLTRDFGKTVIAVTHDLTFAKAADRQIGIVDGRIDPQWRA